MTKKELQDIAKDTEELAKFLGDVSEYCDEPHPPTKHLPPDEQGSCDLERLHGGDHAHFHPDSGEVDTWSGDV